MPSVSRANGERIWVAGARCGFLLAVALFPEERLGIGFLPDGRLDERDAERRDGEVFVAIDRPV